MKPIKLDVKFFVLMVVALTLSALTVVLAAIPLRIMRKTYGRQNYWAALVITCIGVLALGLMPLALVLFSMGLLIGLFCEVENLGFAPFSAALLSVVSTVGISSLVVSVWLKKEGVDLLVFLNQQVDEFVQRIGAINPEIEIKAENLLLQMPAVLVILLIFALALALIAERRATLVAGLKVLNPKNQNLKKFQLPDFCVWLLMLSLLGTFLRLGMPWMEALSLNLLFVLVVLYFFQGIAVVAYFFDIFHVGIFWKVAWYFLLILQLFLFVSVLGLTDYWLDIRGRLSRRIAGRKNMAK